MRLILASPRTGSNHLCSLLQEHFVVDWSSEALNIQHNPFKNYVDNGGAPDLQEYFDAMSNAGAIVPKVLVPQIRHVRDWDNFHLLFDGRLIRLTRQDRIQQAISMFVANETDVWVATSEDVANKTYAVDYNFESILQHYYRAACFEMVGDLVIEAFQSDHLNITYEALCAEPLATIHALGAHLQLEKRPEPKSPPRRFHIQRTAQSLEFAERFRDDLSHQAHRLAYWPRGRLLDDA